MWLGRLRPGQEVQRWTRVVWGLLGAQLVAGFANVALKAPAWMQLTHLLLACLLWLAVVMLVYRALTGLGVQRPARPVAPEEPAPLGEPI